MDFVKNFTSAENSQQQNQGQNQTRQQEKVSNEQGRGGFLGGFGDKLNSAAGGGRGSEKDEDILDKGKLSSLGVCLAVTPICQTDTVTGIDFVQEKFMGQGPQDNESAIEPAKDEQISDLIRGQYKSKTVSDVPIEDKPTRFGQELIWLTPQTEGSWKDFGIVSRSNSTI